MKCNGTHNLHPTRSQYTITCDVLRSHTSYSILFERARKHSLFSREPRYEIEMNGQKMENPIQHSIRLLCATYKYGVALHSYFPSHWEACGPILWTHLFNVVKFDGERCRQNWSRIRFNKAENCVILFAVAFFFSKVTVIWFYFFWYCDTPHHIQCLHLLFHSSLWIMFRACPFRSAIILQ